MEEDRDRKIFDGREKKRIGFGNREFEPVFVGVCFQKAENVLLCRDTIATILEHSGPNVLYDDPFNIIFSQPLFNVLEYDDDLNILSVQPVNNLLDLQ